MLGGLPGQSEAVPLTLVAPEVVAEISADVAFERGRWRHPLRFVRLRLDVSPTDLASGSLSRGTSSNRE